MLHMFSFLVLSFIEMPDIGNHVDHIHSLAILIPHSKIGSISTLMELNGTLIAQPPSQ